MIARWSGSAMRVLAVLDRPGRAQGPPAYASKTITLRATPPAFSAAKPSLICSSARRADAISCRCRSPA